MSELRLQLIQGMTLGGLLCTLARHHFQVQARYLSRLAYLAAVAGLNSFCRPIERAANRRLIAASDFPQAPIFILGHWRSGTTHLHNLLNLDLRFASPTLYQATFPHHFVYSQPHGVKVLARLAPATRPMDAMAWAPDSPHEDEFALAALSGVSPYLGVMFPNHPNPQLSALDFSRLPEPRQREWERALEYFIKKVAAKNDRADRVVLKSPPHTGRIPSLLRLFPEAKFIHMVRDPFAVYLSSVHLWQKAMAHSHLQTPSRRTIEKLIFFCYQELYRVFERDRGLIPPGSLVQVRFEELENNPLRCLRRVYRQLDLGGFAQARPRLEAYLAGLSHYQRNRFYLDPATQQRVAQRWADAFETYGYPIRPRPGADYLQPPESHQLGGIKQTVGAG